MTNLFEEQLAPYRRSLKEHKLYSSINTIEKIQIFTAYHVFAVWDFMSLLKKLQIQLTCVSIPWKPKGFQKASRLINEIVWGEESDIDHNGNPMSHYEMYLNSMSLIESDSHKIKSLIKNWDINLTADKNVENEKLPNFIENFLKFTFKIISLNKPHITSAVFTFGREDLIPDMFIEILKNIKINDKINIQPLIYYFERHIELDSDEHGPLALEMVNDLCGSDKKKWNEALDYSKKAMEMRIKLWDGILKIISKE